MITINVTEVKPGEWAQEPKPFNLVGMPNLDGNVINLTLSQVLGVNLGRFKTCRVHCDEPKYEATISPRLARSLAELYEGGIRQLNLQTDMGFASVKPTKGNERLVIYSSPKKHTVRGDENPRNQTWITISEFAARKARYDLAT